MVTSQQASPAHPLQTAPARPNNGLAVAALVIGVASLVAAIWLFPLAPIAGLTGLITGTVAPASGRKERP